MIISEEMKPIIKKISELDGYKCHGLVNYKKGVSAINENSSPDDPGNYFPQQCTSIINTLITSLTNLNGGIPSKLIVEASNMTMIISIVNDTYFCGVGLEPNTDTKDAISELNNLNQAIKLQF